MGVFLTHGVRDLRIGPLCPEAEPLACEGGAGLQEGSFRRASGPNAAALREVQRLEDGAEWRLEGFGTRGPGHDAAGMSDLRRDLLREGARRAGNCLCTC